MIAARSNGRRRARSRVLAVTTVFTLLAMTQPSLTVTAAGQTYSGCINQYGQLQQVALGGSPLYGACKEGTQVTWNQRGVRGATGAQGPRGKRGQQGKTGSDGERGPAGPAGADLKLRTYSVTEHTTGAGERLLQATATCDADDVATGGGFETDGLILASIGVGGASATGWLAVAQANPEETALAAFVICADLGKRHQEPTP